MSRTDTARRPTDKRRSKALAILREQRCRIIAASTPADGSSRPTLVTARVRGHLGIYAVDLIAGAWTCTCREGLRGECAHAWAVRLITGYGGA